MNKKPNPELTDADNPEWTDEMFRQAVRLTDLPAALQTKLRRGRGPQKAPRKVSTTIRLSPEVVGYFQASGEGWQARIDAALKDWVAQHA
ncbi:MAG: BrnA antitoxin family protein [Burkholderiales bacterium]|nr:BrnA antitoxin family protein [Burkholderiales bacterium]